MPAKATNTNGDYLPVSAVLTTVPALGRHFYAWLEYSRSASLFTQDFAHDKQLIEHALERIHVARDGSLGLQFRQDTMFKLASWGSLDANHQSGHSLDQMRRLLQMHAGLPGDTTVEELDGRLQVRTTPRNDSENNPGVPSGI